MFGANAIIRPKTVVQSHNLDDLEKVARFARQHGVEVFYQPIEPSLLPSSLPLPQPRSPQPLTELAHNPRSSSARLLLQSASAISIRLKRRVWLKRKKSLRRSNVTSLPPAGQRTRGAASNSNLGSVAEGRNLLRAVLLPGRVPTPLVPDFFSFHLVHNSPGTARRESHYRRTPRPAPMTLR